ncbi:N-lysine methyltransferase KMT5A-A isoform X2 [Polypterus senegalus]|uniref:N-lysine methyltransferase KMT5A-A isoform X2 n=1 Tax=Polypterus senegalus TaxID=55291 RepID=UPI001962E50A|nr:N-lysine methyltransferase KMT5A-A isoform X2 [Polypterus senegalus]
MIFIQTLHSFTDWKALICIFNFCAMARGKKKGPSSCKTKAEDATQTSDKTTTKENKKPEMNGEVLCNGQSSIRSFLSPVKSYSRSPLHDENCIPHINDTNSQVKHNGNSGTPKHNEDKQTVCHEDNGAIKPVAKESKQAGAEPVKISEQLESKDTRGQSTVQQTGKDNGGNRGSIKKESQRKVKGRQSGRRIGDSKVSQNKKVTDYFAIRRSSRKSKTELKYEEKRQIDNLITSGTEEGMKVEYIEGKGRAVFATKKFERGEFVVEYHGDLIECTDAKEREAMYAQDPDTGCYMYYFQFLNKTFCVDATKETSRLGRLINHSKNGNCQTKLHEINGIPHLILVASRDIQEGEELLYDYGDRSKASIAAHPWLKH